MIDPETFSALRLEGIFPADELRSYPCYVAVNPGGDFDTEYLGGQWHEELIDGVRFFYPAAAGDKVGIIELAAARCVAGAAVRESPPSPLLLPGCVANADRVLNALELPIRMGSGEAAVRALATGQVHMRPYPREWYDRCHDVAPGSLSSLYFVGREGVYHMQAVVHATEGLLRLDVLRPDLIRANESPKGVYDMCYGGLFPET